MSKNAEWQRRAQLPDEYPFKCELCDYRGRSKNALSIHMTMRHQIALPHNVKSAQKNTEWKRRAEFPEKYPFKCPACERRYENENGLIQHVARFHKNEKGPILQFLENVRMKKEEQAAQQRLFVKQKREAKAAAQLQKREDEKLLILRESDLLQQEADEFNFRNMCHLYKKNLMQIHRTGHRPERLTSYGRSKFKLLEDGVVIEHGKTYYLTERAIRVLNEEFGLNLEQRN